MDTETFKLYIQYTEFGYFLGFFPYHFQNLSSSVKRENGCKKRVVFNNSTKRWLSFLFSLFMVSTYNIFLTVRSVQAIREKETLPRDKIKIFYTCGIFLCANIAYLINLLHYGNHANCINSCLDTIEHLSEKCKRAHSLGSRGEKPATLKNPFRVVHALLIFQGASRFLLNFATPESRELLTSIAQNPQELPFWIKLLCAIYSAYTTVYFTIMWIHPALTLILYVHGVLPLLQNFRIPKIGQFRIKNTVSWSSSFLYSSYHRLAVLQNNFAAVYGLIPLSGEIGAIFIIVANSFLAIVFLDISGFIRVLAVSFLLLKFCTTLADVHSTSLETQESWKGRAYPRWWKKFTKGVRPLRIYVGDFFYADRSWCMTVMGIIIDKTSTLILTYK